MLPLIATAPAEHHQDALLVGQVKELLGLQFAFQADGVQIHIAHQTELIAQTILIGAQQHILRPATAANQNRLSVYAEELAPAGRVLRRDFANPEIDALLIRNLVIRGETHCQPFQVRLAHLRRPPRMRIAQAQHGKLFRRECDSLVFMRCQRHGLLEANSGSSA